MSESKLYLYPVWLRIWHGINALCIIMLGFTGLSMQYTNIESHFIRFNNAVTIHNLVGIITLISYFFFFIANIYSGNNSHYKIRLSGLIDSLIKQARYYIFGYLRGEPKPFPISKEQKFNPLQKISYFVTMYLLVPIIIISGIALLFPELIFDHLFGVGGIKLTTFFHSIAGFFVLIFLIIHLYVITIGKNPLRNFSSIISGYHEA